MDEPLHTFVKPDNTVTLHHFAKVNGDVPEITVDPSRFGESPWSKNEKKADPTPKSFYYLDPKDQESFFQGRTHFSTEYPADKIYDLSKDEKNVLGRIARRGGPVIANTLKVLNRLGYHGVYYSGSFPTVAMLKPVKVRRHEELVGGEGDGKGDAEFPADALAKGVKHEMEHTNDPAVAKEIAKDHLAEDPKYYEKLKLQRIKLSEDELNARTIFQGLKPKNIQFVINGVHFARKKEHFLDNPVWHVTHTESGRTMQLPHDKFLEVVKGLPAEHKQKIREAIGRFNEPKRFARNDAGHVEEFSTHPQNSDAQAVAKYIRDNHETHHPGHPVHQMFADALDDVGHPLGELVRHSATAAQTDPVGMRMDSGSAWERLHHRESRKLLDGDNALGASWLALREPGPEPGQSGPHHGLTFHHLPKAVKVTWRIGAPSSVHAPAYNKTFTYPELKEWLDRWPEHQREGLKDQLRQTLVAHRRPFQLARNGYGYCSCGAPFLKHDKEKQVVYCPNGHSQRRRVKLSFQDHTADSLVRGMDKGVEGAHQLLGDRLEDISHPLADVVRAGKLKEPGEPGYVQAAPLVSSPLAASHEIRLSPQSHLWIHAGNKLLGDSPGFRVVWGVNKSKVGFGSFLHHRFAKDMTPEEFGAFVQHWPSHDPRVSQELERIHANPYEVNRAARTQLSATRAPSGGAIVNNQFHTGGQFLPKALMRIRDVVAKRRKKLARPEAEKVLTPEDNAVGNTKATKKQYDKLVSESFDNHPKSVLPTMDEIKALAKAGESTKGQYEHAGKVLTSFIGPENAKLWVAANAILSPLAKWEHHSRAALRLVRLWREAGSPSDPDTVHKIVERIGPGNAEGEVDAQGKKIYPSVGFYSSKAPKLREMLMNHQEFLKRIENVAATNRGKIVEFGRAFADPNGVPIDTHMGKAVVPSGTEVTGKLPKDAGKDTKKELKDLIRSTKTPHLLARAIAEQGNPQLHSALLEAQKKLVDSPALQKAYKVAIAEAAIQLGWEPRQVQETLWSAVVAIIAAKNRGIATKDILSRLRHENAFQAWNVGGLLSTPEVLHDVGLLSRRPSSAFAAEADRAPSATGQIATGNDPAFEAVAARIPANTRNQGAWNAIQASLRG